MSQLIPAMHEIFFPRKPRIEGLIKDLPSFHAVPRLQFMHFATPDIVKFFHPLHVFPYYKYPTYPSPLRVSTIIVIFFVTVVRVVALFFVVVFSVL